MEVMIIVIEVTIMVNLEGGEEKDMENIRFFNFYPK